MQNVTIGVVLIVLALLVGTVFVLHQFGPDLGLTPAPNMEVKEPEDGDPTLQVEVGGKKLEEELNEEAKTQLSEQHIREFMNSLPGSVPPSEQRQMDEKHQVPHVVKKGETLSTLARQYLGDEKLWQAILDANPSLVRPEDLREGQTVLIPMREQVGR